MEKAPTLFDSQDLFPRFGLLRQRYL